MKAIRGFFRNVLPIFLMFLIVFELAAYVGTATRPHDMFYQLYALGPDGTATNYYPHASESLLVGERLMWYIGASNEMGSVQFVSIRVKLSNQTIEPPNDTMAIPSPAPLRGPEC